MNKISTYNKNEGDHQRRTEEKIYHTYLFAHFDDDIRIAATNITNSKIDTTDDSNAEKAEKILHEQQPATALRRWW